MLFVVQFPLGDARSFVSSETNRLAIPTWPVPKLDTDFIRASGIVRSRFSDSSEDWDSEDFYCGAQRALRFQPLLGKQRVGKLGNLVSLECAFRRFLIANNKVVARLELGLRVKQYESNRQFSVLNDQECLNLIEGCFTLPIKVYSIDKDNYYSLQACRQNLARHYLISTTKLRHGALPNTEEWWVSAGKPTVFIEYTKNEISSLPHSTKLVSNIGFPGSLNHYVFELHKERFGIWFLENNHKNTDAIRKLRLTLSRIHAEKECLRYILQLLISGQLKIEARTALSDKLQDYLQGSINLLSRQNMYGLPQKEILKLAMETEAKVNPGELQSLKTALLNLDFRPNISRNIKRYAEERTENPADEKGGSVTYYYDFRNNKGNIANAGRDMTNKDSFNNYNYNDHLGKIFKKVSSSQASPEVMEQLQQLINEVKKLCQALPDEKLKKDAVQNLEELTNGAISPQQKSNTLWYKRATDNLTRIAQTAGEIAAPILPIISALIPLIATK